MSDVFDLERRGRPRSLVRRLSRFSRRCACRIAVRLGLAREPIYRGYVICTSARSGSTFFCRLLFSTGLLGVPREYFNFAARRMQDPNYPKTPRKQLRRVLSHGATKNRIYGLKIFPSQLQRIGAKVDLFRDLPNPVFVRLVRSDLLGQAISQARARQTGQYGSGAPQLRPPVYDQQLIRRYLAELTSDDEFWNRFFALRRMRPVTIDYESIMRDPQAGVDQVARLVGLEAPAPVNLKLVTSKVQRDEINAEWRRRFLSDTGDEFRHLAWSMMRLD